MFIDTTEWKVMGSPGYSGKTKGSRDAQRDKLYGNGNWKSVFYMGGTLIEREFALQIYEDAYWTFFRDNPEELDWICRTASDVYDNAKSNTKSGLDYNIQEAESTHLQDIAIRRSIIRLGRQFKGKHLVEIRGKDSEGYKLNPGRVPFHITDLIRPREGNPGWIEAGSIEDFWQSNKALVVRRSALRPIISVDVIILNKDGKILLIERNTEPKGWALPGGKVEYGEDLHTAAKREIKEETGLHIDNLDQLIVCDDPDRDNRHHMISVVFVAEVLDNSRPEPGDGVKRTKFFSPNGIPDHLVFDHKQILSEYFSNRED